MVVGRHLVESCPRLLWIDGDIRKTWDALRGAREYLLGEGGFVVGAESVYLLRIVPRQQEPAGFRTKVEAVRHVDDHRRGVRKSVEWFRGHEHAAQRLDRQRSARKLRHPCSPWAGGVHDDGRRDLFFAG